MLLASEKLEASYQTTLALRATSKYSALLNLDFVEELPLAEFAMLLDKAEEVIPQSQNAVKVGRGHVRLLTLASGRRIIIRASARGGLIQKLLKYTYFRSPFCQVSSLRPFDEIKVLAELVDKGINVPVPVAAVVQNFIGKVYFRSYVITELLPDCENLLEYGYRCKADAKLTADFFEGCVQAGREARKMLNVRVFHQDLHLGNVLFAKNGISYLIDFDRATRISEQENIEDYAHKTFARWARSATKHELGDLAVDPFRRGLFGLR
jgi:tRNA A-37 threonylcarbamoyl transferase component Bud32